MPGLLDTAVTGLRVSQSALRTAGHNIANANTAGFSRQNIEVQTNIPSFSGSGYIGNGASVVSVQRTANEFVTNQLRVDTSLSHSQTTFSDNIRQLDTLLSDPSSGLSSALDTFFATIQNGADDPTSIPARQLIISEADNLAARFHTIYESFETMNESVNQKMQVAVSQINALASNIANLNVSIASASGASDNPPNDLLDQRDEALRELSELVSIQTYTQGDQLNVIVGGGQSLVVGAVARELTLIPGELDPTQKDVAYRDSQGSQTITRFLEGGEVGGLLEFRESILADSFNELGRIAMVMASTFNDVHSQGVDLNNNFGGRFFRDVNEAGLVLNRAVGASTNSLPDDRVISVEVSDSSQMTASDYSMEVTSANGLFRIVRLSDNVEVAAGTVSPASLPQIVEFDGLRVGFQEGSFQSGDRFLIQPTRNGARDFETEIFRPDELAFASPLATEADLGNIGNGSISPGELLGLEDVDGNPLSLFSSSGEMSPPLVVVFTSANTYDVLDNSDPSNPADLDPPIRNRRYLPGVSNPIFTSDMEQTLVASGGLTIGLPAGSTEITQASLQIAAAVAPNYGLSDFSSTANQFSFDVVVSGTGTSLDKTTQIVIANAAITDDASLLIDINNDLAGNNSGVTAYINDAGTLAFRLDAVGDGQITLNNYDNDPDGGLDLAPAGQADTLLGFAIESTNYTTVGNADGVSGVGSLANNYPSESLTFTHTDPETGTLTSTPVFANANASARETASLISSVSGVSASARNYLEVSNLKVTGGQPLQMSLNGEDLLEYSSSAGADYPDPSTDPMAFNAYMAERINSNANLSSLGIHAVGGTNPVSGRPELRVYSSEGDDLVFAVSAAAGESADVSDGVNTNVTLNGSGNSTQSSILVGGSIDVTLAADIVMISNPTVSSMFGDSTAADFAQSTYRGIQAELSGNHQAGDKFTLDFNTDGVSDNRNALNLGNLQTDKTIDDGDSTYSENYAKLVEQVGIETSAAEINSVAAEQVLQQIEDLRNSISAVNLDEEAANLIQFEQIYNANAQVISVARDLFDRLLGIF